MKTARINWEVLFEMSGSRVAYELQTLGGNYYVYNYEGLYFSLFLSKKQLIKYLEGKPFVRVACYDSEQEIEEAILEDMSTTYVLFGREACEAVDLGRAIPQNANYALNKYTIGSININQIISDTMGWEDYAILTSKQYYKLKQQAK